MRFLYVTAIVVILENTLQSKRDNSRESITAPLHPAAPEGVRETPAGTGISGTQRRRDAAILRGQACEAQKVLFYGH